MANTDSEWNALIKEALKAKNEKRFKEAIAHAQDALNKAINEVQKGQTIAILGSIYQIIGEYNHAERCYGKAIPMIEGNLSPKFVEQVKSNFDKIRSKLAIDRINKEENSVNQKRESINDKKTQDEKTGHSAAESICIPESVQKAKQIFNYLKSLNQLRNPALRQIKEQGTYDLKWSLWFRDLPDHPSIRKAEIRKELIYDEESGLRISGYSGDDYILKIRRPTLTPPPNPPDSLKEWLLDGWQNVNGEAKVHESRNIILDGETHIEYFSDNSERVRILEAWRIKRDQWAHNEKPVRNAFRVFEKIYEIHGHIRREEENIEIVLGDGILKWRRNDGDVHHPILLQKLQLEFHPEEYEFVFLETESPLELYSGLFNGMNDIDGRVIRESRNELEKGGFHPLSKDDTSAFLRSFVARLSAHGIFSEDGEPKDYSEYPVLARDPVVFLRKRTTGFNVALESILEELNVNAEIPSSVLNIAGLQTQHEDQIIDINGSIDNLGDEDIDILFGKEANPEQLQIAKRLNQYGSVLVQGPPGTGKSHTIANLIGHLLSQKKSVLVTSHTTKALKVLKDHIEDELKPLCISVLEGDVEGRRQLEYSVQKISEKLSLDEHTFQDKVNNLTAKRKGILDELKRCRHELLKARRYEYEEIVIAGDSFTPSEAAKRISKLEDKCSWLPSPLSAGAPLPLSQSELIELYRTNEEITKEEEVEINHDLPDPEKLWEPRSFRNMIQELTQLSAFRQGPEKEVWMKKDYKGDLSSDLNELNAKIQKSILKLNNAKKWEIAVIDAGRQGKTQKQPWIILVEEIKNVKEKALEAREYLIKYKPELPTSLTNIENIEISTQIIEHLKQEGNLGKVTLLRYGKWKKFINDARVRGVTPRKKDHFESLLCLSDLIRVRAELVSRWNHLMVPFDAPKEDLLGESPENIMSQYVGFIVSSLKWYEIKWLPTLNRISSLGFNWERLFLKTPPNMDRFGEVYRLKETLEKQLLPSIYKIIKHLDYQKTENVVSFYVSELKKTGGIKKSVILKHLYESVVNKDCDAYEKYYDSHVRVCNKRKIFQKRKEYLKKLDDSAPSWTDLIRNRIPPHNASEIPGEPKEAWIWRQLLQEIERRNKVSITDLMEKISSLKTELKAVTNELISTSAWLSQKRRTNLEQRQALNGWLQTVRRIGKGTGKRVPEFQAKARELMKKCRSAVPVWIMPLPRVVENFDPSAMKFDVVIIDEASQCDVMGLIAVYMGKKVVIVGDNEQVSPEAVGLEIDKVKHLITEHLDGIPNNHLYDGQISVYDLGVSSFGGSICLTEHFRCVSEIIQFSNGLSYNWRIKPLRDESKVLLKPHVVEFRVNNGICNNKENYNEAEVIASLMLSAIENIEYEGKTFGVISLLGYEQSRTIESILRKYISPSTFEDRRIICGNPPHFQGDERDVIFLSVVDSPREGGPLSRRSSGPRDMWKKRYNVAASRAKDQMWVIHSLNIETDLHPDDLRYRLIKYARNPRDYFPKELSDDRPESEFEKLVLRHIRSRGYKVRTQWKVGNYRIDLVVQDGEKKLAVECDGDKHHTLENIEYDMVRQAILERLGWTFVRIRGSVFFRNQQKAMEPVFEKLNDLEIFPQKILENNDEGASECYELKNNIIRRAEEIRREWLEGKDSLDIYKQFTNAKKTRNTENTSVDSTIRKSGTYADEEMIERNNEYINEEDEIDEKLELETTQKTIKPYNNTTHIEKSNKPKRKIKHVRDINIDGWIKFGKWLNATRYGHKKYRKAVDIVITKVQSNQKIQKEDADNAIMLYNSSVDS